MAATTEASLATALHALLRDIVRTSEIVGFELTEFEATIFGLFARSCA